MTQPKPTVKWKFDLQILLATLVIILACTRGILWILYSPEDTNTGTMIYILWCMSSLCSFMLTGFLLQLFRPVPLIRNIIVRLILFIVGFALETVPRIFSFETNLLRSLGTLDMWVDIASFVTSLIFWGQLLRNKFRHIPGIQLLRTYAIVAICTGVAHQLAYSILFILPPNPSMLNWLWGLEYVFMIPPVIFLIKGYNQMKSYPSTLFPAENAS